MLFELGELREPHLQWTKTARCILGEKRGYYNTTIDIPVTSNNMLVVGKIGCGKTTLVKKYVSALLEDDDTYMVCFEVKPKDYSGSFMRQGDKVISFRNIVDEDKMFKWGLIREIKESKDPEAEAKKISSILFEHLKKDSTKQIWVHGAEETFEGFLNTVVHCIDGTPSNYDVVQRMREMSPTKLLKFLAHYPQNRSLLEKYYKFKAEWITNNSENSRKKIKEYTLPQMGADILVFLQNVLSSFSGSFLSQDGQDTISDWLSGKYGKNLFITYDLAKHDSMSMFIVYFLKTIILERVSLDVDKSKKILMVLDEIPELSHEFGLEQGVTVGRENRLQVILSTQSLEKLYAIAPDLNPTRTEHYTNAMLSGFPTLVCFQLGDPFSISTFQKFFGNKEKEKMLLPLSRYSLPDTRFVTEPIVADEDFASLSKGECYIKIDSAEPVRLHIMV